MTQQPPPKVRFGASWSTQYRFTQAIGRGLSDLTPIEATVVIGRASIDGLASGELDVLFSKSLVNEHRYQGKGYHSEGAPEPWIRSIAWMPQEDRFLFAVAPWTGITSFEEIFAKKPALHMAGGGAAPVLEAYGFSYADIASWGGSVSSMGHTAKDAKARYDAGTLDACFGDGSAYDFSAWPWMANRGYRFLDISEAVMQNLEAQGLRRNITPSGFLPGISETLLALDDSHIVFTCHERFEDELAYLLAKVIDERKREIECASIQVDYATDPRLPLIQPSYWSSLTGPIDRQWDDQYLGAPLHPGAERYYREQGYLDR